MTGLFSAHTEQSKSTKESGMVFKAEAPVDPEEEHKYGFGSIWPGKEKFFSNRSSSKKQNLPMSVKKVQTYSPKKDRVWESALHVLQSFPISYANKESGIIKTEEVYVHEFDTTDSCQYKIIISVSDDGEISVIINSPNDSKNRLQKHEQLLKTKIMNAVENTES